MNTQIQKARKKVLTKVRAAFSLVELLVVIAVIGIIAAIAIPNIAGITNQADVAKGQRNAQSLASTFASARAAGHAGSYATAAAAVTALGTGIQGTGNFATTDFKVPGLSATDQTLALTHLTLSATDATGQLEYTP
ncbi:MAG: prepilin-type N-terminal cleavage/methylation domain-containing protein [Chthoniobacterales bacterium]